MSEMRVVHQHTLCLPRSSFDRGADIILRRTDEGAAKCALRALRREEETSVNKNINCQNRVSSTSTRCQSHPTWFDDNVSFLHGKGKEWWLSVMMRLTRVEFHRTSVLRGVDLAGEEEDQNSIRCSGGNKMPDLRYLYYVRYYFT